MAWFRNHYECARCGAEWTDDWSCTCDDDCPDCGARHMSPVDSDDLTEIVEQRGDLFFALRSPANAGHYPDYVDLGAFTTRQLAEVYLSFRAARGT